MTEVGAGIRLLQHAGRALLDGFDASESPDGGRGQVLAPWPNRLRHGRWKWQGRELRIPVNDPDRGNSASHGLVRWASWSGDAVEPGRVRLSYRMSATPGYPFPLDFRCDYRLHPTTGLTVELSARNSGTEAAPVALGAHPYLLPGGTLAEARLRLPAATRLVSDEHGVPVERVPVAETAYDFREARPVGMLHLNHSFTDFRRDADGRVRVELSDASRTLEVWAGSTCRWMQVYSGDTLDPPARRRSIAIEPMTAPPQSLASGEDLAVLEPGAELTLTWGVTLVR